MSLSSNKKKIVWGVIVLLLFLFVGVKWYFPKGGKGSRSPQKDGFGTVVREDLIQRVTIAGEIAPLRKTIITAPYNGYVKKLFVKVGDVVIQEDEVGRQAVRRVQISAPVGGHALLVPRAGCLKVPHNLFARAFPNGAAGTPCSRGRGPG